MSYFSVGIASLFLFALCLVWFGIYTMQAEGEDRALFCEKRSKKLAWMLVFFGVSILAVLVFLYQQKPEFVSAKINEQAAVKEEANIKRGVEACANRLMGALRYEDDTLMGCGKLHKGDARPMWFAVESCDHDGDILYVPDRSGKDETRVLMECKNKKWVQR